MDAKDTLRELMTLSPVIENRIEELSSSAMQVDFDPAKSVTNLIKEAMDLLIDLLNDCGIEIYADEDVILADRYNIGYVCTLYRQFATDHIRMYLYNNRYLIRNLCSSLADVSDNEFVVKLLEVVRNVSRTSYDNSMYGFLFDKIRSTQKYSSEVIAILHKMDSQSDSGDTVMMTEVDTNFLLKISAERRWYQSCINTLIFDKGIKSIDYPTSSALASRFCMGYCLPKYLVILSKYDTLIVANKDHVLSTLNTIHKESEYYADHYSDTELASLQIDMVIGIVLAQISDNRLFGLAADYTRLMMHAELDIPVVDIIKAIPTQNKI